MRKEGTKYDRRIRQREQKAEEMLRRGILPPSDIAVCCKLNIRKVEAIKVRLIQKANVG